MVWLRDEKKILFVMHSLTKGLGDIIYYVIFQNKWAKTTWLCLIQIFDADFMMTIITKILNSDKVLETLTLYILMSSASDFC